MGNGSWARPGRLLLCSLTDVGVSGRGVWGAALSRSQNSELFVALGHIQLMSATALSHYSSTQDTPSPQPAERGTHYQEGLAS